MDPKTSPGFYPYPAWDGDIPLIDCAPMNARITERSCQLNKEVCKTAIIRVLEGLSPFILKPEELDRLFWCGRCPRFLRWDDVAYTRPRKRYNPEALVGDEGGEGAGTGQGDGLGDGLGDGNGEGQGGRPRCAEDVIRLVEGTIRHTFLRIEGMDMVRGIPEVSQMRKREQWKRHREGKRVKDALKSWGGEGEE